MGALKRKIEQFIEDREGEGALDRIGSADLLEAGWIDSLDLVEMATIVSENSAIVVDLSNEEHFAAMRSIPKLLKFFG